MNELYLATNPTEDPCVFDTYWKTGLVTKGRVRITVPYLHDGKTAAELSAAKYLLETKCVCGHNKAGSGLILFTSCGTIQDLLLAESDKIYLAPYANFLRTRFLGAEISVAEAPYEWADERCETQVDFVEITSPGVTTIEVAGIGQVELTVHAIDRYMERFERPGEKAWRELIRLAKEVKPVVLVGRNVFNDIKHRRPAQHLLHEKRGVLFVVAAPDRFGGLPRLVSVQVPMRNAKLLETA